MNKRSVPVGIIAALSAFVGLVAPASARSPFDLISQAAAAAYAPTQCGAQSASRVWQAFAHFGDQADYWLAPGGDFEGSTNGWTFRNASVVRGNETTGVLGGKRSLSFGTGLLTVGAEAVSPSFCITEAHPTFRYVLKANGAVGALSTFIRYRAADGSTQEQQVYSRTATNLLPGQWKPSDLQPLATKVPMAKLGGVAVAQLVFRSPVSLAGSSYQIDDVLIDPYRTR